MPPDALPLSRRTAVVMLDTRVPDLVNLARRWDATDQPMKHNVSTTLWTQFLNLKYACAHGYSLIFSQLVGHGCRHPLWGQRHPSYCKLAAVEAGMGLLGGDDKELKAYLLPLMDELEASKAKLAHALPPSAKLPAARSTLRMRSPRDTAPFVFFFFFILVRAACALLAVCAVLATAAEDAPASAMFCDRYADTSSNPALPERRSFARSL